MQAKDYTIFQTNKSFVAISEDGSKCLISNYRHKDDIMEAAEQKKNMGEFFEDKAVNEICSSTKLQEYSKEK